MKRVKPIYASQTGFTLIEVIATIIIMGILAAFFIHFMGTALNRSWQSVELVAGDARAQGLMEKIIAEYVEKINSDRSGIRPGRVSPHANRIMKVIPISACRSPCSTSRLTAAVTRCPIRPEITGI